MADTDYDTFAVLYIYKELEGALSTMVQLYSEAPLPTFPTGPTRHPLCPGQASLDTLPVSPGPHPFRTRLPHHHP